VHRFASSSTSTRTPCSSRPDPRAIAREFLGHDDVLSLRFESGAVVVETAKPDAFYARLTEMARATGSRSRRSLADDNLQPCSSIW